MGIITYCLLDDMSLYINQLQREEVVQMNKSILFIIVFLLAGCAPVLAGNWSIHTYTAHIPVANSEHLKLFTPGIGYTHDGYRFGYFRNSFDVDSFYAAKLYPYNDQLRFGMGAISGYKFTGSRLTGHPGGIIPLLVAEFDITDNISVLWMGRAFNLEVKF